MRQMLLLVILLAMLGGCERKEKPESPPPVPPPSAPPQPRTEQSDVPRASPQASFADVVERAAPGVVTIRAARRARAPRQHPFFNDPLLREFFGGIFPGAQPRAPQVQMGLGSGVIVKADGTILTNHHVIDGAEDIKVELTNHQVLSAKVVGSDPPSDLAVLKIEGKGLAALPLGDSDRVRVGDIALAIGNPLGIGQTVTAGIISAKGRSTGLSDGSFEDFLQTDAPINQGNSGGALISANGELIGINSQILSPSGGNIGIGFAIPSNMARSVMEHLVKSGKVQRGQLGVSIQPMTPELASSLGVSEIKGVVVNALSSGGPADRAGIRRGDIIVAFDGKRIDDGNTLRNLVASTAPGTKVNLTVIREGREQQVAVPVGEYQPAKGRG